MNCLAKMRVLTVLLTLLGKHKSKPEVKLWFMWKKYFLKTMDLEKYEKKKRKLTTTYFEVVYLKQIVES